MTSMAVFCYEASPQVGAGHAMRCITLANALVKQGWQCYLAVSEQTYHFIPYQQCFTRIDPDLFWTEPMKHQLLVVDHYKLDAAYESHFRCFAEKILVIDDLANRQHDCDILLDLTYGRNQQDYQKLVSAHCVILVGTEYALLRPEFAVMRPQALLKRQRSQAIKRILVNMGGSDPQNYILEVLKAIKRTQFSGAIDIVLGFSSLHLESVQSFVQTMQNNITIHQSNHNMAQLLCEADLAICAAGGSAWERSCLGLPTVLVQTADNQQYVYRNLNAYFKQRDDQSLDGLVNDFFQNFSNWQKVSQLAFELCDGFGVNRLINAINGEQDVKVRKATTEDLQITFEWQQQKEVRQYFLNPNPPVWEEHQKWFLAKINHSLDLYYIVMYKNVPCGALMLTFDYESNGYELSWYLSKEFQGKGVGTKVLKIATNLVLPYFVQAVALPENLASVKSLHKAGFRYLNNNKFLSVQ